MKTILILVSSFAAAAASAQGGFGAHGGDMIACFSIPLEQAVKPFKEGYLMTDAGRSNIIPGSAVTLEYFRAGEKAKRNPFLHELENSTFEEALDALESRFKSVPGFYVYRLRSAHEAIGLIPQTGLPDPYGIERVADSGTDLGMPEDCALLQAVVRQKDRLTYDSTLWKAASNLQKALLQLHEEVFYVGTEYYHQTESVPTQLLLLSMIADDADSSVLSHRLTQYGFFSYFGYSTLDELNDIRNRTIVWLKEEQGKYLAAAKADCGACADWASKHGKALTECPWANDIALYMGAIAQGPSGMPDLRTDDMAYYYFEGEIHQKYQDLPRTANVCPDLDAWTRLLALEPMVRDWDFNQGPR